MLKGQSRDSGTKMTAHKRCCIWRPYYISVRWHTYHTCLPRLDRLEAPLLYLQATFPPFSTNLVHVISFFAYPCLHCQPQSICEHLFSPVSQLENKKSNDQPEPTSPRLSTWEYCLEFLIVWLGLIKPLCQVCLWLSVQKGSKGLIVPERFPTPFASQCEQSWPETCPLLDCWLL